MQAATLTAVVVLPTPPFWLAMAYTMPMAKATLSTGAADLASEGRSAPCWHALGPRSWQKAGVWSRLRVDVDTSPVSGRPYAAHAACAVRIREMESPNGSARA